MGVITQLNPIKQENKINDKIIIFRKIILIFMKCS